jgi:hypothetical protein
MLAVPFHPPGASDANFAQHRTMVGPIDESAEEYDFICEELAHTERRGIAVPIPEPETA